MSASVWLSKATRKGTDCFTALIVKYWIELTCDNVRSSQPGRHMLIPLHYYLRTLAMKLKVLRPRLRSVSRLSYVLAVIFR